MYTPWLIPRRDRGSPSQNTPAYTRLKGVEIMTINDVLDKMRETFGKSVEEEIEDIKDNSSTVEQEQSKEIERLKAELAKYEKTDKPEKVTDEIMKLMDEIAELKKVNSKLASNKAVSQDGDDFNVEEAIMGICGQQKYLTDRRENNGNTESAG